MSNLDGVHVPANPENKLETTDAILSKIRQELMGPRTVTKPEADRLLVEMAGSFKKLVKLYQLKEKRIEKLKKRLEV